MQTNIPIQQVVACLIREEQYAEAEVIAKQCIHTNPVIEMHLRCYLGLIYTQQERNEEAIEEFKEALYKKSDNKTAKELAVKLLVYQGECRAEEKDWVGVSSSLSAAIEISPDDPRIKQKFMHLKNILPISYLNAGKREEAAEFWENEQKQDLADHSVIHHTALLYYWWSMDAEKKYCHNDVSADIKSLDLLWEKTIANWAMLINTEEFWREWKQEREDACSIQVDDEYIKELHTKLSSQLKKGFHDYADHYREGKMEDDYRRHEQYQTALALELKSASCCKELLKKVSRDDQFIPPCGPLMINQLDRMSDLNRLLEAASKIKHNGEKIRKLKIYFSPLGRILILIEQKKTKQAIAEIDGLSYDLFSSDEGKRLRATAYLERGREIMELEGDPDSALYHWEKGMDAASDRIIKQQLDEVISETCNDRATRLMNQNKHDDAIAILEKGKDIITDRSLREPLRKLLAINYCDRGIARINESNDSGGERDLERALKYDSDNRKVRESLAIVCANKGAECMERHDVDGAIINLKKALEYNPHYEDVKKGLAGAYNAKGVRYAERDDLYEARKYLKKALELDPYDKTIRNNLAAVTGYGY